MMKTKSIWPLVLLVICAAFYVIWPVAHTGALRKILLVVSACIGVLLWVRSEDRYAILRSPWLIFTALLFCWVLFHAGFIAQNRTESWQEFVWQWLPAGLAVLAGIGLALASRSIDSAVFKMYLLAGLVAQIVLLLLISMYKSMQLGPLADGFNAISAGTDLKISLTYSSDMLAALGCAKFVASFDRNTSNAKRYIWLFPIAFAMGVSVFTATLNSILLLSGCIVLTLVLLARKLTIKRTHLYFAAIIFAAGLSVYAASHVPTLERQWARISGISSVALDIDGYTNWVNIRKSGLPHTESGEMVPESFYLRVAYARAGIRAIFEHPWGYGITVHAFERLIQQKYSDVSISHAHNGYINLISSVGFPAFILLLLVLFSSYRQLLGSSSAWAVPAIWILGIFTARWALDAMERDHFFASYLFVIALLLTLTVNKASEKYHAR